MLRIIHGSLNNATYLPYAISSEATLQHRETMRRQIEITFSVFTSRLSDFAVSIAALKGEIYTAVVCSHSRPNSVRSKLMSHYRLYETVQAFPSIAQCDFPLNFVSSTMSHELKCNQAWLNNALMLGYFQKKFELYSSYTAQNQVKSSIKKICHILEDSLKVFNELQANLYCDKVYSHLMRHTDSFSLLIKRIAEVREQGRENLQLCKMVFAYYWDESIALIKNRQGLSRLERLRHHLLYQPLAQGEIEQIYHDYACRVPSNMGSLLQQG